MLAKQIATNDKDFQINLTNRIREINPMSLYMQSKKSSNESLRNEDNQNVMKLKSSNMVQTQSKAMI